MSSFTAALVERTGDGLYSIRGQNGLGMRFYVGNPTSGISLFVPEGFVTDGPSLPHWLKRSLKVVGLLGWVMASLMKPSIVHDKMREDLEFSLLESDAYFLIAMQVDRPNWSGPEWAKSILQWVAFYAVRMNHGRSATVDHSVCGCA